MRTLQVHRRDRCRWKALLLRMAPGTSHIAKEEVIAPLRRHGKQGPTGRSQHNHLKHDVPTVPLLVQIRWDGHGEQITTPQAAPGTRSRVNDRRPGPPPIDTDTRGQNNSTPATPGQLKTTERNTAPDSTLCLLDNA